MICNVTNLPNQTVEKQTNNMSFKMAVRKPAPQHIDRYINVLGLSEESRGFFNNILLKIRKSGFQKVVKENLNKPDIEFVPKNIKCIDPRFRLDAFRCGNKMFYLDKTGLEYNCIARETEKLDDRLINRRKAVKGNKFLRNIIKPYNYLDVVFTGVKAVAKMFTPKGTLPKAFIDASEYANTLHNKERAMMEGRKFLDTSVGVL